MELVYFNPEDNTATVTAPLKKGVLVFVNKLSVKALQNIPQGHKIAVRDIKKNQSIIKYGQVIAVAKKAIKAGEYVHTHNVKFSDEIQFKLLSNSNRIIKTKGLPLTFKGYVRFDKQVGVRNYILVVAPVNCSATVVQRVAKYFQSKKIRNIDAVVPVTYGGGCAQAIGGENYAVLNKTIAGWINNPNVVGAVIIGLGCETINYDSIIEKVSKHNREYIEHFNIQDVGGTKKAITEGIFKVKNICAKLPSFRRTEVSIANIKLALNCGGSDAFSGLTANPALGIASDIIVKHGGTAVLAEFPECHGVETNLMQRCVSKVDKEKLRKIISWWEKYAKNNGVELNDNLAKGNIIGGISTILEKSLGAVAKAGCFRIAQVLRYAEPITKKGLVFMDTPGFDPVSVTGLVAGGCTIVAFTTGRGSTYGASIAPTIKISTNTELFKKLEDDMDVNAGDILAGKSLQKVGEEIYKKIIAVANGEQTKSENLRIGFEEFVPWQFGEIL